MILNADCLAVLDNDSRGGGIEGDLKVPPVTERSKESGRAALSNAVLAHRLSDREPCDLVAVMVRRDRVSSLGGGCEDVLGDVWPPGEPLDVEQPAGCVILPSNAIDLRVVLRAHEIRQDLLQSREKERKE